MTTHLNQYPALVLNADFTPKSVFPLSVINWQDAIKGVFMDKYIRVIDYNETVKTQRHELAFPSVVAMKQYVHIGNFAPFNRHNIWIRDQGKCAYCKMNLKISEFTFDHVIPKKLGGNSEWENIVCACRPCNSSKADKPLRNSGLKLAFKPHKPTTHEIAKKARKMNGFGPIQKEWVDFLYWETELEK